MIIFDKCGMTKFFIIRKEKVAYMDKMDKVMEGVLEYLKRKGKLTELENDILLATQICQSSPFDSEAAKKKIMEFNAKYREVCSSPGISGKEISVEILHLLTFPFLPWYWQEEYVHRCHILFLPIPRKEWKS